MSTASSRWPSRGQAPGRGVSRRRVIFSCSGCEGLHCGVAPLLALAVVGVAVGDDGESGAVQDVEAEVAAAFGPLVVLFGQDGADEADQRVAVGEDAHDV